MTFRARIRMGEIEEWVTWDDGELSGFPFFVESIRGVADAEEGEEVGPVGGPYTTEDHLEDPVSAAVLIREAADEVLEWTGDVPSIGAGGSNRGGARTGDGAGGHDGNGGSESEDDLPPILY